MKTLITGSSIVTLENRFDDLSFHAIQQAVEWESKSITLYGKSYPIPRLTASFGKQYSYSGISTQATEIPIFFAEILAQVRTIAGSDFNSVLLNYYRDGTDSISWHQDDEPEVGTSPVIASVSLGSDRIFKLKNKTTGEKTDTVLSHGDLLVMAGDCQTEWLHCIPKTKKPIGPRISLTFRRVR